MPWQWLSHLHQPRSPNELPAQKNYCACSDVSAVGEHVQAGTNCGSCRSEIQNTLTQHQSEHHSQHLTHAQTLNLKCTTSPSRRT